MATGTIHNSFKEIIAKTKWFYQGDGISPQSYRDVHPKLLPSDIISGYKLIGVGDYTTEYGEFMITFKSYSEDDNELHLFCHNVGNTASHLGNTYITLIWAKK